MTSLPTEGDTLDQLQSPEQTALLDVIEELRGQGLERYGINFPQLIVCGEQSTGKSSLLEGLTGLRFPTKGTLCTTFATEVALRRATNTKISCTIMPCDERSQPHSRELLKFERTFSSREEFSFPSVIEEAKALMTQGSKSGLKTLLKDVLKVRYSGPDLPSLTIVDLPGMIEEDLNDIDAAERIVELVTGYMQNEKSIILAVVMAGNDPENQKPFKYLRKYDPDRSRTLGIITKPDKVDRDSDSEIDLLRLARNEKYTLKHGWYAVRNRDFATKDHTDAERDELERNFFNSGLWATHPRDLVGIPALRVKLSKVLLEHITMELPSLVTTIQGAIDTTESNLKALGSTRQTSREQRTYLTGNAEKFQMLTNDALRGIYSNRFFELAAPDKQAATRLRTAIQNLNIAFANTMYRKGHTWDISADQTMKGAQLNFLGTSYPAIEQYGNWFEDPLFINRTEFLESHIGQYVRQSRPSGLPSLVNPWVIGEVFREQSQNWSKIAKHHLQQVFQAVQNYIREALGSLLDPRTHGLLMLKEVQPELDRRWSSVDAKLEELLVPYTEQDPITYDPGFLRDLEGMRAARYQNSQSQSEENSFVFGRNNMSATSNSSQRLLTESLDDFTNSEILDLMQTYYKSAISVFINNVAVLAIENCLIKDLSAIFSPTLTANMDDEQLHAIAAECDEMRQKRTSLREKLEIFQSGKRTLHQHIASRPISRAPAPTQTKDVRTHAPQPQKQSEDNEKTKRGTIGDLTSSLNNLGVTPLPSGPNSRTPSRGRHDSVTGTPKKPSPRRLPKKSMILGLGMQDDSDEEL